MPAPCFFTSTPCRHVDLAHHEVLLKVLVPFTRQVNFF